MINFEEEIAQRDARIAELEEQADEGTSSNKYRAELYDEVWQTARDMGYGNVTAALQELAALKAQQPSAGVVLPERMVVPGPLWKDARQPYGNPLNASDISAAESFNLAIDEVARLNPCRAQAVPDGYALVPVEPTPEMIQAGRDEPLAGPDDEDAPEDYRAVYRAMIAAAVNKRGLSR